MAAGAAPRPGLRSLLGQPAYRRLWTARTISQVGDVAQSTTLALLVVALTGSGLGVSAVVLAEIVPVLLLAPLAGSLVDRLPEQTRPVTVTSPSAHAGQALAALREVPLLKALAVGQLLAALSAGATSASLVVLAQERLGGADGFGLLVAAIGAAAASVRCCSCGARAPLSSARLARPGQDAEDPLCRPGRPS